MALYFLTSTPIITIHKKNNIKMNL